MEIMIFIGMTLIVIKADFSSVKSLCIHKNEEDRLSLCLKNPSNKIFAREFQKQFDFCVW